jgi:hypothetical protein
MMKRAMVASLALVGLLAWVASAQSAADALPKLDAIAVEATTVIEANVHLPKRQKLPQWVIDAQWRILELAEEAKQIIILSGPAKPPAGGGVTCNVTAASLSNEDVQTAVNNATTGQTVCLPGDTEEWNGSPPYVVADGKDIKIIGAGKGTKAQCEVPSQTTYTCITGTTRLLGWDTPLTGNPELGHMTFIASSCAECEVYDSGLVQIYGRNPNVRIHDIGIDIAEGGLGAYSGLMIFRSVTGVGWNISAVQRNLSSTHATIVLHQRWTDTTSDCSSTDSDGCGGKSWASASTMGTDGAWYWEDSTWEIADFSNVGHCTDDFSGARIVYRYNTLVNCQIQNHGTETGGRRRGFREVDYHRNNSSNSLEAANGMMNFRGGSGYAWGNVFTTSGSGSITAAIQGTTYRRHDTSHNGGRWPLWNRCGDLAVTSITFSGTTATVTVNDDYDGVSTSGSWVTISGATGGDAALYNGTFWATGDGVDDTKFTYTMGGTPGGNATGTLKSKSPFDGNTDSTGKRCLDGLGVGQAQQVITGDTSSMSFTAGLESASQPLYNWANTINGTKNDLGAQGDVTVVNVDIFHHNESFTGATGIGVGAIGSRPSTCTTGVAYWATDEGSWNTESAAIHANHGSNHSEGADGKLYICTATNTWTAKYGVNSTGEPYAYPHPLRAGIP